MRWHVKSELNFKRLARFSERRSGLMTIQMTPMTCRDCGANIPPSVSTVESRKTAERFADCYFHCPNCGVGYSNTDDVSRRTKIYPHWDRNIPNEVHDGVEQTLECALNEASRPKKANRFAFETSEDAVSWTVFRYLFEKGEMTKSLGFGDEQLRLLLFWGVAWPLGQDERVREALVGILRQLRESRKYFSEPDVIVVTDERVVFIEAKYTQDNTRQPNHERFGRYLESNGDLFCASSQEIESTGYYELVRNWVIGNLLARHFDKQFTLINLGLPHCRDSAQAFGEQVAEGAGEYRFATWADMIERIDRPMSMWFADYLQSRSLHTASESDEQ